MKFHISKNGRPAPCKAPEGKCPLIEDDGSPQKHFESEDQAYKSLANDYEEIDSLRKYSSTIQEKIFKQESILSPFDEKLDWIEENKKEHSDKGTELRVLGSFKHNGEDLILLNSKDSISPKDLNMSHGMIVSKYSIFDKSGEEVAYLKTSHVDDESFKRDFGDDFYRNLRFNGRYSGDSTSLVKDTENKFATPLNPEEFDEDEQKKLLKKEWELHFGNFYEEHAQSKEEASLSDDEIEIPPEDIETLKSDLKVKIDRIDSNVERFKKSFAQPFVDYSSVSDDRQGTGLGKIMYAEVAKDLGKRGLVLRGSGTQTDKAKGIWQSFKKNGAQVSEFKVPSSKIPGKFLDQQALDYRLDKSGPLD